MDKKEIKLLPEDLINKIAAGEVVERPASVVKELVENAIDAKARQIIVEIQSAGKKLIKVSDNGQGMTEAEIKLALQRHSTSKISSFDDLFNINTLGFRGEALPSIASVSKMTIEPNPSGAGLTVAVKELFYNTPARRKFLKSETTEIGHIGDVVSKYTLAYPGIAFKFISDGKIFLASAGTGQLLDAMVAVYGGELAKGLIKVDHPFAAGRIFGFSSLPTISRIDKNYETFFVNGRYIKNFLLNRALEEAYRTLIPSNRYPAAVIFVEIDPNQVDVNVHPTKKEVKFANNQIVMEGVRTAIYEALKREKLMTASPNQSFGPERSWQPVMDKTWQPEMMDPFFPSAATEKREQIERIILDQDVELNVSAIQPLIPVYQFLNTYIVATDGKDLTIIDQHAAHERILYDQLSCQSAEMNRQTLLIPETIELSAKEGTILLSQLEYFGSLGFDLDVFGANSFLLRSVPAVSVKAPAKQLLVDLLAELSEVGKSVQMEVKKENLRKLIACHSAIKAGDKLSGQEMNQLIKDLYATQNPLTCPHGRPTMVRLSETELIKRFGR